MGLGVIERQGTKKKPDPLQMVWVFCLLAMKDRAPHGPIGNKVANIGLFDKIEDCRLCTEDGDDARQLLGSGKRRRTSGIRSHHR
jgi:hypothetical protein